MSLFYPAGKKSLLYNRPPTIRSSVIPATYINGGAYHIGTSSGTTVPLPSGVTLLAGDICLAVVGQGFVSSPSGSITGNNGSGATWTALTGVVAGPLSYAFQAFGAVITSNDIANGILVVNQDSDATIGMSFYRGATSFTAYTNIVGNTTTLTVPSFTLAGGCKGVALITEEHIDSVTPWTLSATGYNFNWSARPWIGVQGDLDQLAAPSGASVTINNYYGGADNFALAVGLY